MEFKVLKDIIKSKKFKNENLGMEFYTNGQLHMIYLIKNKVKHGISLSFYVNGNLELIESYKNNKWPGQIISLWPDSLGYIAEFKNNTVHCLIDLNESTWTFFDNGRRVL